MPEMTEEQREHLLRAFAEFTAHVQATIDAFVQAFMPTAQAVTEQFAQLQQALQHAGLLDADGRPTRTADRPAWQSPYGPPKRRR